MSLYYCESESTRAIFHIVKIGNRWHIYNVFEDKSGEITSILAGVAYSKKALIELTTSTFERTVDISKARKE